MTRQDNGDPLTELTAKTDLTVLFFSFYNKFWYSRGISMINVTILTRPKWTKISETVDRILLQRKAL
jgi:hypothetical protein